MTNGDDDDDDDDDDTDFFSFSLHQPLFNPKLFFNALNPKP
jgi:hypothetical protein